MGNVDDTLQAIDAALDAEDTEAALDLAVKAVQRFPADADVRAAYGEALWAMVSSVHLAVPGVDYAAHAAEYRARTDAALSRYAQRHGAI